MPNNQLLHPAADQLSDFALGRLEPALIDDIEVHLSSCDACCQTLKGLHQDTFVSLIREAACPPVTDPQSATMTFASGATPASGTARSDELPSELANHPRYRLVELVGTGGMGAVFKAEHRLMQRTVALKIINPKFVSSASAAERFRREIQAAARLQHPNIVTAYDAEQAGGMHFFVMEYVNGTDLQKLLDQRGPLPVAEACEYVRQAALGLQHAHENGMVHRDIKPHNLMVIAGREPGTSQVKIFDFGLATLASEAAIPPSSATLNETAAELTQIGTVMGTPDYMAPEQGRDAHQADVRADIYSLGCTLYTLLAGRVPFPGGTPLEKIKAHAEREPQPLTRADLPPRLATIVERMMAKDPAARYQTPAEVATALAPLAGPAGVKRSRRLSLVLSLAAAAALLFGIIFVTTSKGQLVIDSQVDDVQIVVTRGGDEVEVIDLKSGTTVKRLPSGEYAIKVRGERTDVKLDRDGFEMSRWGQSVVKVTQIAKKEEVVKKAAPRKRPTPTDEIAPKHRAAIDKGLAYLVKTQHPDGNWEAEGGQYPISMTALSGMAMLMEGSAIDDGKYADSIRRAVDYLMAQSQPNGLLADPQQKSEQMRYMFGHGYSMLFLSTIYSQDEDAERRAKLHKLLTKAVDFTASATTSRGGWGYVRAKDGGDFDESATTIVQLQALRAARNAGIVVPRKLLDVDFMRRATAADGGVVYSISNAAQAGRPALTAAALSVGEFDSDLAKKWMAFCQKTMPLGNAVRIGFDDFTHYYYAQGIYLLGEKGYQKLFPQAPPEMRLTWSKYRETMFDPLVARQAADGSWPEKMVGPVYGTACSLTVLQLDNAAVPIYQR